MTPPAPMPDQLQQALAGLAAGDLARAIACCQAVLTQAPAQPDALHLLAVAHAHAGRFDEAQAWFARAHAAAPRRADILANQGAAWADAGQLASAHACARRALGLDANCPPAHNLLGRVRLLEDRPGVARDHLERAVAADATYFDAWLNLGNAAAALGERERAHQAYRRAQALHPAHPGPWANLGQMQRDAGQLEPARASFEEALRRDGRHRSSLQGARQLSPAWELVLQGRRLSLARSAAEDAEFIAACQQDAAFMRLYHARIDRQTPLERLRERLSRQRAEPVFRAGGCQWLITQRRQGRPVGLVNLADIDFHEARAELVVGVPGTEDRLHGYALEACLLVLDLAFTRLRFNKITAVVYDYNAKSIHDIQQLGFRQESHLRQHLWDEAQGRYIDLLGFGMTAQDFQSDPRLARLSRRLLTAAAV